MLKTRFIVSSAKDIPNTWIFEHYLSLTEKLDGKDVSIKSVFNPGEKIPSMKLYFKSGKYMFKDFSTGYSGDGFNLVQYLYGLDSAAAYNKILSDYNDVILKGNYSLEEFKKYSKFQVSDYQARKWNTIDAKFWTQFGINSKLLKEYNVLPLANYVVSNEEKTLTIEGPMIYGYFMKNGLLYKIYQPNSREKKFLKVKAYIQGSDQLTYTKPNLVIHSSLKDIMSFNRLNFKTIECIAPDAENVMLPESVMWDMLKKYENVITLFDNDRAGKACIEKYKTKYGINGFTLDMEKDVSDSVKIYGLEQVKNELYPLLLENLYTCRRCPEISTLE